MQESWNTSHGIDDPAFAEYDVNQTLAANVHMLRKAQNMDKTVFSQASGISRPLLNKIEAGTADVRLSYLQRLADTLSVQPATLLTRIDDDGARRRSINSHPWL